MNMKNEDSKVRALLTEELKGKPGTLQFQS